MTRLFWRLLDTNGQTNRQLSKVVKINSKYKEDDFSDSNTPAFSLDICVLKSISSSCSAHMSNPRSSQLPPGIQSGLESWAGNSSNTGSLLTPLWWWRRYSDSSRRSYPKGSQFIMHSRDNIIAHSQHDKPRSLPTRLDKSCCSRSCWSASPTWRSTSLPWSTHNIHH